MCMVCERIEQIKSGTNPHFVKELETGYAVLGDHQRFKGYTLFLCKKHVTELHQLEPDFRKTFLWEMSLVEEAVFKAFQPDKINYELLGNGENSAHMHWHLFPRRDGDMPKPGPVWWLPAEELFSNELSAKELERMKLLLKKNLTALL